MTNVGFCEKTKRATFMNLCFCLLGTNQYSPITNEFNLYNVDKTIYKDFIERVVVVSKSTSHSEFPKYY